MLGFLRFGLRRVAVVSMNAHAYADISQEAYSELEAVRFSDLKHMDRSPLAYHWRKTHGTVQTAPMKIGNACHLAILEPDMFNFAVWPGPGIRRGRAFDDWCAVNDGKVLLNKEEYDHVRGVADAVHANPIAHKYLAEGERELSLMWDDTTWARPFKARIDNAVTIAGKDTLVSLKTTTDCHDRLFAMQYVRMCYMAQDAIYQSGWFDLTGRLPRMITVAVESKAPYESAVYEICGDWLLEGQAAVTRWVRRLNECERSNTWPVAYEAERELEFPAWAATLGEFAMEDLEAIEE
jgi:hypothetical protein